MTSDKYVERYILPEARVMMLQLMDTQPDGEIPAEMVTTLLRGTANPLWFDQVVEQARWLQAQGLCEVEETDKLTFLKITRSGSLVAKGLKRHDGVDRPRGEV